MYNQRSKKRNGVHDDIGRVFDFYRDGNKRIASLALYVFLGANGVDLEAPEADVVSIMPSLAAGELSERALAKWFRTHRVRLDDA